MFGQVTKGQMAERGDSFFVAFVTFCKSFRINRRKRRQRRGRKRLRDFHSLTRLSGREKEPRISPMARMGKGNGSTENVQEPFSAGASSHPVNLNPAVNVAAKERRKRNQNKAKNPTHLLSFVFFAFLCGHSNCFF